MTKTEWINLVNGAIGNERNALARSLGAEAYLFDGKIQYRDRAKGYARRVTFRDLLGHLHGIDMRAILAAKVA